MCCHPGIVPSHVILHSILSYVFSERRHAVQSRARAATCVARLQHYCATFTPNSCTSAVACIPISACQLSHRFPAPIQGAVAFSAVWPLLYTLIVLQSLKAEVQKAMNCCRGCQHVYGLHSIVLYNGVLQKHSSKHADSYLDGSLCGDDCGGNANIQVAG